MNLLKSETINNQDIADFTEVITYTATTVKQIQPHLRITNLSGAGGNYIFRLTINDSIMVPEIPVFIGAANTSISSSGRPIILEADDVLVVSVRGLANDLNVNIVSRLFDTTPTNTADFVEEAIPLINAGIALEIPNLQISVRPERNVICPTSEPVVSPVYDKPTGRTRTSSLAVKSR